MTIFERCPYRATDPITTRTPRDDGWRCGHEAGHTRNHELYTADGEHTLPAGEWVLGPDDFTLSAKMEAERAWNKSFRHYEWDGAEVNLGVHMAKWARKRLINQLPANLPEIVETLRRMSGDYALHAQGIPMDYDACWDQGQVRAWQAAEALSVFVLEGR